MKRAALAIALFACGSPSKPPEAPEGALVIAPLDAGASAKATSRRPAVPELDLAAFVASDEVQSVTPVHAGAFLNVAALRRHRLADRFRDVAAKQIPGADVADDLEWVLYVGPDIDHPARGVVLLGVRPGVDVEWKIDRLMRGSRANRAKATDVEIDGVRGWRVPDDPGDRLILRVGSELVVIVREPQASSAIQAFRKRPPGAPPSREIAAMFANERGAQMLSGITGGQSLDEMRFVVEGRDDGGAELRFGARAPDAATATTAAQRLTDVLAQANAMFFRTTVRGLLDDAKATANGNAVSLVISADEAQMSTIVDALAAVP